MKLRINPERKDQIQIYVDVVLGWGDVNEFLTEEEAAAIVTAVNQHEKLVAEVKDLKDRIDAEWREG